MEDKQTQTRRIMRLLLGLWLVALLFGAWACGDPCGNGYCNRGWDEDEVTCPDDCPECPNDFCSIWETERNCPEDCAPEGAPPPPTPEPASGDDPSDVIMIAPGFCGDGTCDTESENSDLCPEDCPCVDDGECAPGEGFNCLDCGEPADSCGAPCEDSDDCAGDLSCFSGACWEDCICEGDCGGEDDDDGSGGESCTTCTTDTDCGCPNGSCQNGCCSCP